MVIFLKKDTTDKRATEICEELTRKSSGKIPACFVNNFLDNKVIVFDSEIDAFDFHEIEKIVKVSSTYKLANRMFNPKGSHVKVGNIDITEDRLTIIAGPCSVESKEQLVTIAKSVKNFGASILRGGAFKPRTSPYTFQGLGEKGLKILREVSDEVGIPVVTELMDTRDADLLYKYTDMIQIGTRNGQNYPLLSLVGQMDKPVLLKRAQVATVKEFIMASEYILCSGNSQVVLCERGIKTFEYSTRNTLDLSAVPLLKELTHLPVIVDPSHAAGNAQLVPSLAYAAAAAGADGVMLEVHNEPSQSFSDERQALPLEKLPEMIDKLYKVYSSVR